MELPKNVINELKQIRVDYERKEKLFDENFVFSLYDAIDGTELFRDKTDIILADKRGLTSCENNGEIWFSLKGVEEYSMEILSVFTELYTEETKYLIKNYFAILTMIHEFPHVSQDLGLDEDEVVNEFYSKLFSRRLLSFILAPLSDFYSHERHANIDANKTLIDVYDDSPLSTIPKTYYLNLIEYLYGKTSPTEKMQMMFLLPDYFDTSKLSNMKKLEVGFPVEKEILDSIDNELIREARGEIDFYECKKRIVGIANGIKY